MNYQLYFEGQSSSVAPGSRIVLEVFLDSPSAVNAVDLSVVYPTDALQFLGSDNSDSIVDIWQQKPEGDAPGIVNFSGGILKPFTGTKGELIKLSFVVKDEGSSTTNSVISFAKNNIYLADGKGTKINPAIQSFPLVVQENAPVVSEQIESFQNTSSDSLVAAGLKNYSSKVILKEVVVPTLIFVISVAVLAFCIFQMYNKNKRKQ